MKYGFLDTLEKTLEKSHDMPVKKPTFTKIERVRIINRKALFLTITGIVSIIPFLWLGNPLQNMEHSAFSSIFPGNGTTTVESANAIPTSYTLAHGTGCFHNPKIDIFMYHYIRAVDPREPRMIQDLSIGVPQFESHMKAVRKIVDEGRASIIHFSEISAFEQSGCWPNKRIFVFTSDDGWIDGYSNLFPVSLKYNVPFSFAIIASRIGKDGFMNAEQIQSIRTAGGEILSHSVRHQDEDRMTVEEEEKEMCDSKKTLEGVFGQTITGYVYPAGKHREDSGKILQ